MASINLKNPTRSSLQFPQRPIQIENIQAVSKKPNVTLEQIPKLPTNDGARAFGRNITNVCAPQEKRQRNNIKKEIKNQLIKLKRPSVNLIVKEAKSVNSSLIIHEQTHMPVETEQSMVIDLTKDLVSLNPQSNKMKNQNQPQKEIVAPVYSTDPQICDEYSEEIDIYLRKIENLYLAKPGYMMKQSSINEKMRAILIDWLVDVHIRFKLVPETLFLTVNLIDRYLEKEQVARQKLQLVGVTAMMIASKYEEIYPPEVKDYVYITDNAYTKEEVLKMEEHMLHILNYNMNIPSSLRFLQRFGMHLGTNMKAIHLAHYMIELSLIEAEMLKYSPSMIAASALYIGNKLLDKEDKWNEQIDNKIGYNSSNLKLCAKDLITLLQAANRSTLQAVKKKFSSAKFMDVGQLKIGKK